MLEIKNLTGGYVHVPVLKDVSFTVESGQLVGLIGLNLSLIHISEPTRH